MPCVAARAGLHRNALRNRPDPLSSDRPTETVTRLGSDSRCPLPSPGSSPMQSRIAPLARATGYNLVGIIRHEHADSLCSQTIDSFSVLFWTRGNQSGSRRRAATRRAAQHDPAEASAAAVQPAHGAIAGCNVRRATQDDSADAGAATRRIIADVNGYCVVQVFPYDALRSSRKGPGSNRNEHPALRRIAAGRALSHC